MIIKDKEKDVIEVNMVHTVYLGKLNAHFNFEQYLNQIREEFNQAFTKYLMNIPAKLEDSHIIMPD